MSNELAAERTARLRTAMTQQGIDWLVLAGNAWRSDYLRFAVDITPMEGVAIALIPREGVVRLWVDRRSEQERMAAEQPSLDVKWAPDPVAAVEHELTALQRVALATVHTAPTRLARGALGSTITAATAMLDKLILNMSPLEADAVERACHLADAGYAVFREAALVGRREFEMVAELETWFRAHGCPENFMIMGSGGKEVRTMRPPGERRLQEGDLVTTELTPCVDGYYAQICRTLVIGTPTKLQLDSYAVYRDALEAGVAAVRPGATFGDVARAQNDVFRSHGLAEYITSKYTRVRGHGVGLYVDGTHVLEDVDTVLAPDMTLIVHPNTYHPDAGYIVLGDVVRVTPEGCRVLTRTSRRLQTVPVRRAEGVQ